MGAGRVVGGPVGWLTSQVGWIGWWGGGVVALMLGWPKCMEIRLFRGLLATKSRLRRPVFVFLLGGPGPLRLRAGAHSPRDQKHTARC